MNQHPERGARTITSARTSALKLADVTVRVPACRSRLHQARGVFVVLVFAMLMSALRAVTIGESFSTDPSARGWRSSGDASLFRWNATDQNMEVTWDSSRTNSYFWLPLRTIISRSDDFGVAFDLTLRDIAIGTTSNKSYTFEIAIGFMNFSNAIGTNFFRGAGQTATGPRNLVEFDYFPDSGFGATFAPTVVATNHLIYFSDNHPLVMTTNDLFHIEMMFTATNRTLKTLITKNGAVFGVIKDLVLSATADFRCDSLAIMSYCDAAQFGNPQFWGSVLAHGTVDNLVVKVPDPPVQNYSGTRSNGTWRAQFISRTNWSYVLERTSDLATWSAASATNTGSGGVLLLQDTNTPATRAFYRVNALKP